MRFFPLCIALAALLTACVQDEEASEAEVHPDTAEPQASTVFEGRLDNPEGIEGAIRLGVAWFDMNAAPTSVAAPVFPPILGDVEGLEVDAEGSVELRFDAPPPDEAILEAPGFRLAIASVVVFVDHDGDGRLQRVAAGAEPVDRVLVAPPTELMPERASHLVYFVEGTLPEAFDGLELAPGYSLVRLSPEGAGPVDRFEIGLHEDEVAQTFMCAQPLSVGRPSDRIVRARSVSLPGELVCNADGRIATTLDACRPDAADPICGPVRCGDLPWRLEDHVVDAPQGWPCELDPVEVETCFGECPEGECNWFDDDLVCGDVYPGGVDQNIGCAADGGYCISDQLGYQVAVNCRDGVPSPEVCEVGCGVGGIANRARCEQ